MPSKSQFEVVHKPNLVDGRAREGAKAFTIFFMEFDGLIWRACLVKVMTRHPWDALTMVRGLNPRGRGFMLSDCAERPQTFRPVKRCDEPSERLEWAMAA